MSRGLSPGHVLIGLVDEAGEDDPEDRQLFRQSNTTFLVRVEEHEPRATIDLSQEGVVGVRWWTREELATSDEQFAPPDLPERVNSLAP